MATKKFSDLANLALAASGDYFPLVDVSDLTMGATGTDKTITAANLATSLLAIADINTDSSGNLYVNSLGVNTGAIAGASYLDVKGDGTAKAPVRIQSSAKLSTPSVGMLEHSPELLSFTFASGSRQSKVMGLASTSALATITNSTAETSMVGTVSGSQSVAANMLQTGKTIKVSAWGFISTASSPGTLTMRFKIGSLTLSSTVQTPVGSLSNRVWKFEGIISCYSNGGSGTVAAQGVFQINTSAILVAIWDMVQTSAATLNTTIANTLDFTAQWGTASTSNIITGTNFAVEVIN